MNYFIDLQVQYTYEDSDYIHSDKLIIKCESMRKAVDLIDCLESGCEIFPEKNIPVGWSASLRLEKGGETDGE